MLRTILACLFFSVFLAACSGFIPTKKKLLVYTQITTTNDTLNKLTGEWYKELFAATRDKNFSRLRPYRIKIGEFLNRKREEIANLEVGPEGQNVLDSEIVFLSNQAARFSETYATFELFNEMTPNETINGQLKIASADIRNMTITNAMISRSLQQYAAKNKLKVKK